MKQELFKQEVDKIFTGFANQLNSPAVFNPELDLYKKLWNFFLTGDSYYFIFNYHTLQCDVVSKEAEAIHDCKLSEFDLVALTQQIHPHDYPYFLAIAKKYREIFSRVAQRKINEV